MRFKIGYLLVALLLTVAPAFADNDDVAVSPKKPWGDFKVIEEQEGHSWWVDVLLWVPNRVMDLVDVFRVDAGVGPAYGAVIRVTKYGQAGVRIMSPASVRIGDFGREVPFLYEESNEYGVTPYYTKSRDRKVCTSEVGVGLDLLIVGAYTGICVEEAVDFIAGLFFIDLEHDDL